MARIRTIKPEFFKHEELYLAEVETGLPLRAAFPGLWCACDREGRFRWKPNVLKLDILPFDQLDFSRVLDALETRGFIVKYAVGKETYGFIPSFGKHQVINNREKVSELPTPCASTITTRGAHVAHALGTPLSTAQGEGNGRELEGKGSETPPPPPQSADLQDGLHPIVLSDNRPIDAPTVAQAMFVFESLNAPDKMRKFFEHYEANGWVDGRGRSIIMHWQSKASKWISDDLQAEAAKQPKNGSDFEPDGHGNTINRKLHPDWPPGIPYTPSNIMRHKNKMELETWEQIQAR